MSGRYSGPVRFFYLGDESVARQYNGIARKLVAYLQNQSELVRDNLWTASRRVKISDGVIIEVRKVTDLIYNAYIDARGVTADPIVEIIQYQFVYTGGAGNLWDVYGGDTGGVRAGGSAVGVVFILREGGVDHVAIPLVSTLLEPNVLQDPQWVYVADMESDAGAWQQALLIARYEIAHASSQHIFAPDKQNIVYSAWMPKGGRHYMAQAFTLGSYDPLFSLYRYIIPAEASTDPFPPTDNIQTGGGAARFGTKTTDVTYETSLMYGIPPEGTVSSFEAGPKKVEDHRSAPDTDWYTSYGMQQVDSAEFGARRFGIMVDASQNVHVWPTEAKDPNTDYSTLPYAGQSIKTDVPAQFAKSQALVFPAEVYSEIPSFRDSGVSSTSSVSGFQDGPLEYATRYVWAPSPDGTKYATIVERLQDPKRPYDYRFPSTEVTVDDYYFSEGKTYQFSDPVPAKFEITITVTGPNLEDFTISVSPVTVVEVEDTFYPIQAGFASDYSFANTTAGELLIAGFRVRRLDNEVDTTNITTQLGDSTLPSLSPFYVRAYYNCNVLQGYMPVPPRMFENYLPYVDLSNGGEWNPDTGVALKENFQYEYRAPQYMKQDLPFHSLLEIPELQRTSGTIVQSWENDYSRWKKSWTFEGELIVTREDTAPVFSLCIRKYNDNPNGFLSFFTARVNNIDVSKGAIALGLCESSSSVSGVTRTSQRYPGDHGLRGDLNGHTASFSSTKGYAIFNGGVLEDTNNETLAQKLVQELTSIPLDKNLSFWGCLRVPPQVGSIHIQAQQIDYFAPYGNTQYMGALLNAPDTSANDVAAGYYGIFDFPWGLEMYSWFASNHHGQERYLDSLVCGPGICTYTGAYLDIDNTVELDVQTHLPSTPVTVSLAHIDVLKVGDQFFSHAQLYEEAFGEPAQVEFNVRAESIYIGHPDQGYPVRAYNYSTPGTNPSGDNTRKDLEYRQYDPHALVAVSATNDDVDVRGQNLLHPMSRVYCDLAGLTRTFDPDEEISYPDDPPPPEPTAADRRDSRAAAGALTTPFVARAFSYVEITGE